MSNPLIMTLFDPLIMHSGVLKLLQALTGLWEAGRHQGALDLLIPIMHRCRSPLP